LTAEPARMMVVISPHAGDSVIDAEMNLDDIEKKRE
jgi:hypothetical protein